MSIHRGTLQLYPPYDLEIRSIPINLEINGDKLVKFSNFESLPTPAVKTLDCLAAYARSVSLRDAIDTKKEPCQYGELSITYLDPKTFTLSFQREYSLKVQNKNLFYGSPVPVNPVLKISRLARQLLNCNLMIFKFKSGNQDVKESFSITARETVNEGRYSLINATRDPEETSKFNFSNKILLIEGEFNMVDTDATRMSGNITITTVSPEEKKFANQCTLPVSVANNLEDMLEVVSTDSRYSNFTFLIGTTRQQHVLLKRESTDLEDVFI